MHRHRPQPTCDESKPPKSLPSMTGNQPSCHSRNDIENIEQTIHERIGLGTNWLHTVENRAKPQGSHHQRNCPSQLAVGAPQEVGQSCRDSSSFKECNPEDSLGESFAFLGLELMFVVTFFIIEGIGIFICQVVDSIDQYIHSDEKIINTE